MITRDDIKVELRIDLADTSEDSRIDRALARMKRVIKLYCNNYNIEFDDTSSDYFTEELDDVLLYLCVLSLNPETSLRAGKTSESQGASFNYIDDLPSMYKKQLKRYRRLNFL